MERGKVTGHLRKLLLAPLGERREGKLPRLAAFERDQGCGVM